MVSLNSFKMDNINNKCAKFNNLISMNEVFWCNDKYNDDYKNLEISLEEILDAERRFERFAPFIEEAFPETKNSKGIIESTLIKIDKMKSKLEELYEVKIKGELYCKCDNNLPISGSIKARGGIYEVLKYAESLVLERNMISIDDNYKKLNNDEFKNFFSKFSIVVASTGNLGLSIGIISKKFGFNVRVHMSKDAKKWKKDLLRNIGAKVVEHDGDYSTTVRFARNEFKKHKNSHFVDDENSRDLFLGYSVAALRLKNQLEEKNIEVDSNHPLFVYLPCGVGGAPGGITFGLKRIFKENVHCFFAEPTHSPCMLLGLMTGMHDKVNVKRYGIDNITDADGLAVGKPSGFVGNILEKEISGIYTVDDSELYKLLFYANEVEELRLEPSALTGFIGPIKLNQSPEGHEYINARNLTNSMESSTHIVWATGGNMVPENIMNDYLTKGYNIAKNL